MQNTSQWPVFCTVLFFTINRSHDVLQGLKDAGVSESTAVSVNVNKELRSGYSSSWFKDLKSGSYIDDHLIRGAVSEMDLCMEPVVTSTLTSSKIMSAACPISNDSVVQKIANRMKLLFMAGDYVMLIAHFINGTQNSHWRAVLAKKEQVYWGDCPKCAPFASVLETVIKIMKKNVSKKDVKPK